MQKFLSNILLVFIISGCVETNRNIISGDKLASVRANNKALIIMQTTPLVAKDKKNQDLQKRVKVKWANCCTQNDFFYAKNYRSVYVLPEMTKYRYHNIEVYLVTPGKYFLQRLNYAKEDNHEVTLYGNSDKGASFAAKAGEVLYVGNIVINFKDNDIDTESFLNQAMDIQDNYSAAQLYVEEHYPQLLPNLQKRLLTLSK